MWRTKRWCWYTVKEASMYQVRLCATHYHRTILSDRSLKLTQFCALLLSTVYEHCYSTVLRDSLKQSTCIAPCMVQTTLKRSGMDHTVFNLQRTPCLPLPRKRSPDGASTECGGEHLIATHYSFIESERMKGWVGLVGWPIADGLPT